MITLIVVVLYLVIITADLLPGWKENSRKDNFLYCILLAVSFSVLILYTFNVPIPSPATPIKQWLEALLPMLKK